MAALVILGAVLALGGFIGLALSTMGRTAFPAFVVMALGLFLFVIAGVGRLVGLL